MNSLITERFVKIAPFFEMEWCLISHIFQFLIHKNIRGNFGLFDGRVARKPFSKKFCDRLFPVLFQTPCLKLKRSLTWTLFRDLRSAEFFPRKESIYENLKRLISILPMIEFLFKFTEEKKNCSKNFFLRKIIQLWFLSKIVHLCQNLRIGTSIHKLFSWCCDIPKTRFIFENHFS